MFGAYIKNSPQNWQILQQDETGFANAYFSGSFCLEGTEPLVESEVYIRVMDENTNQTVVTWTKTNCKKGFSGEWDCNLLIPAGGLYRIETCVCDDTLIFEWGKRGDMRHHIGVGDVYVIAGQSNSAGYGKDSANDEPMLGVHLYRNSNTWDLASHPMNENTNVIDKANYEGANSGTSPYLSFAKMLKKKLNYPIGLIQASLGGSPLEWWNPIEDGRLYKNMIDTIKTTTNSVKGILWYQGCSDTDTLEKAKSYFKRFNQFVTQLRNDLQIDVPILTCGLNRHIDINETKEGIIGWATVREMQRRCMDIDNVFLITTLDCPLSDAIHNSSLANIIIGERLAKSALYNIYNFETPFNPATIDEASFIDKNTIKITFKNVYEKLVTHNYFPIDVYSDDILIKSTTVLNDNKELIVTLEDNENLNNISVSMCYEKNPMPFPPFEALSGMPVVPFYKFKVTSNK